MGVAWCRLTWTKDTCLYESQTLHIQFGPHSSVFSRARLLQLSLLSPPWSLLPLDDSHNQAHMLLFLQSLKILPILPHSLSPLPCSKCPFLVSSSSSPSSSQTHYCGPCHSTYLLLSRSTMTSLLPHPVDPSPASSYSVSRGHSRQLATLFDAESSMTQYFSFFLFLSK